MESEDVIRAANLVVKTHIAERVTKLSMRLARLTRLIEKHSEDDNPEILLALFCEADDTRGELEGWGKW